MINFKQLKNEEMDLADMSSFKGHVHTTYYTLLKVLGYPQIDEQSDADKTPCEWVIYMEETDNIWGDLKPNKDGVATIYCYKELTIPRKKYHWNIGGHNEKVVDMVNRLIAQEENKENPFVPDYLSDEEKLLSALNILERGL
jgi:hypothetical protein